MKPVISAKYREMFGEEQDIYDLKVCLQRLLMSWEKIVTIHGGGRKHCDQVCQVLICCLLAPNSPFLSLPCHTEQSQDPANSISLLQLANKDLYHLCLGLAWVPTVFSTTGFSTLAAWWQALPVNLFCSTGQAACSMPFF